MHREVGDLGYFDDTSSTGGTTAVDDVWTRASLTPPLGPSPAYSVHLADASTAAERLLSMASDGLLKSSVSTAEHRAEAASSIAAVLRAVNAMCAYYSIPLESCLQRRLRMLPLEFPFPDDVDEDRHNRSTTASAGGGAAGCSGAAASPTCDIPSKQPSSSYGPLTDVQSGVGGGGGAGTTRISAHLALSQQLSGEATREFSATPNVSYQRTPCSSYGEEQHQLLQQQLLQHRERNTPTDITALALFPPTSSSPRHSHSRLSQQYPTFSGGGGGAAPQLQLSNRSLQQVEKDDDCGDSHTFHNNNRGALHAPPAAPTLSTMAGHPRQSSGSGSGVRTHSTSLSSHSAVVTYIDEVLLADDPAAAASPASTNAATVGATVLWESPLGSSLEAAGGTLTTTAAIAELDPIHAEYVREGVIVVVPNTSIIALSPMTPAEVLRQSLCDTIPGAAQSITSLKQSYRELSAALPNTSFHSPSSQSGGGEHTNNKGGHFASTAMLLPLSSRRSLGREDQLAPLTATAAATVVALDASHYGAAALALDGSGVSPSTTTTIATAAVAVPQAQAEGGSPRRGSGGGSGRRHVSASTVTMLVPPSSSPLHHHPHHALATLTMTPPSATAVAPLISIQAPEAVGSPSLSTVIDVAAEVQHALPQPQTTQPHVATTTIRSIAALRVLEPRIQSATTGRYRVAYGVELLRQAATDRMRRASS